MEEHYYYDPCNRLTAREILNGNSSQGNLSQPEQMQYHYDLQGNMLSDGRRQFTYDAMNRLAEVRNGDGSFQKNRYDGEGLRAELEENGRLVSFIFDGDKVVTEEEDQNTIRYIRGYDLISSDSEKARTYYHYACDEMGSITHVTDEAGAVLNRYEYDAFGEFICKEETVANRFAYTGEQYDPVAGMYYLRARFYNPVIGRFLQEDTYYGDGLNLYAYCHNNPVGYVDPSGHGTCPKKQSAIDTLMAAGFTKDQAEKYYKKIRRKNDIDTTVDKINRKYADHGGSGSAYAQTPRTSAEWQEYFQDKYGTRKVKHVTAGTRKTPLQYALEWHNKRVREIFGQEAVKAAISVSDSELNHGYRRIYDASKMVEGINYDIEYKSDNFSKKPRTQKELAHIRSQIEKDIYYKNQNRSNPYWHFEHDPRIAPEMKPLLDMLDEAEIEWTFGPENPFST